MEAIVLHLIYATAAVLCVRYAAHTIQHRDRCRKEESIGLASMNVDAKLLEEHKEPSTAA